MTESIAKIIKSKMEDAGYYSDDIYTAPIASSTGGTNKSCIFRNQKRGFYRSENIDAFKYKL